MKYCSEWVGNMCCPATGETEVMRIKLRVKIPVLGADLTLPLIPHSPPSPGFLSFVIQIHCILKISVIVNSK